MFSGSLVSLSSVVLFFVIATAGICHAESPYATEVVSYAAGTNAQAGYNDPRTALGMPSMTTAAWPSGTQDVTMFASPWGTDQIVSIGADGSLIVKFDHKVMDEAGNPFGIDFIIFGSAMFIDASWPDGIADGIMSEPGKVAVSQDGVTWYEITGASADDLFPTQGFENTSTAQGSDGSVLSDFTRPVDPTIDWVGKSYAEILADYDGSGGGAGVDISETGLGWIQYVKIYQDGSDSWSAEIDALADVAAIAAANPLSETIEQLEEIIADKTEAIEAIDEALAKEEQLLASLEQLLADEDGAEIDGNAIAEIKGKVGASMNREKLARKMLVKSVDMLEKALDVATDASE